MSRQEADHCQGNEEAEMVKLVMDQGQYQDREEAMKEGMLEEQVQMDMLEGLVLRQLLENILSHLNLKDLVQLKEHQN